MVLHQWLWCRTSAAYVVLCNAVHRAINCGPNDKSVSLLVSHFPTACVSLFYSNLKPDIILIFRFNNFSHIINPMIMRIICDRLLISVCNRYSNYRTDLSQTIRQLVWWHTNSRSSDREEETYVYCMYNLVTHTLFDFISTNCMNTKF